MFKKKTSKRNWGHHLVVILLRYSQPRNELKRLYYKGMIYIYCIFTNKPLQSLHLFPAFLKLWLVPSMVMKKNPAISMAARWCQPCLPRCTVPIQGLLFDGRKWPDRQRRGPEGSASKWAMAVGCVRFCE